jgi:hypothetical protein
LSPDSYFLISFFEQRGQLFQKRENGPSVHSAEMTSGKLNLYQRYRLRSFDLKSLNRGEEDESLSKIRRIVNPFFPSGIREEKKPLPFKSTSLNVRDAVDI